MINIAVLGGGASGLVAAIVAARGGSSVTIYERTDRVGKKILATGNGCCNLTNIYAKQENYYGQNSKFVLSAISKFTPYDAMDFFSQLGVVCRIEPDGKVYPYSDQASSVLDVLRMEIDRLGIKIVTDFEAKSVCIDKAGFKIVSYQNEIAIADRVIVAVGGRAAPNLGSNGSGYEILKELGHNVTPLQPALVQIKTDTTFTKALKGIKVQTSIKILDGDMCVGADSGEVLFTDYGLSGPPIFQLSRHARENTVIELDVMPNHTIEEVRQLLHLRKSPNKTMEQYFIGMFHKRLGQVLLKVCGISELSRCSDLLTEKEIDILVNTIKGWKISINGRLSWNNAQVTMGGVDTKDVSPSTMESKLVNGLYITGELLDVDGDCGGYNLQWAWASGFIAGEAASK